MAGLNSWCFLVKIGSIVLRNQHVGPDGGASVGDLKHQWSFGVNDGGFVSTGFNDSDNNQRGLFTQTLRVWEAKTFARIHENLRWPRPDGAV